MTQTEENVKIIPISYELSTYVERLNYEDKRYTLLLDIVNKIDMLKYMTKEEYEDSLNYFTEKKEEARISLNAAIETIGEIYAEPINNQKFDIDFADSSLVISSNPTVCIPKLIYSKHVERHESFADTITRIYNNTENPIVMDIGGTHPMSITIQVTDACNMACTYCYQHNKGNHSMSFETAKRFIDMILAADSKTKAYIDANKSIGVIIDFIGGEPLLEINLIDQISDYFVAELFKRKHHWAITYMFSMSSNGLLYFKPSVQNYLNKHSSTVNIGISIDGNKKLHDACRVDLEGKGTYTRAIAAAKDLMNNHNSSNTKMTIAPGNVEYLYDAVVNMLEVGYRSIFLNCVYEEGWTVDHARTMYHQLIKIIDYLKDNNLINSTFLSMLSENYCKPMSEEENRNWCGGTGLMMAVDYKGDIYPCLRYMESSVGTNVEPYIIGNLDEGICINKTHCDRVNCFKCVTRKSQSTEECFNCPIASGCGWCSAYNYEVFGTVNKRTTYTCIMHKARSLANAYYLALKNGSSIIYCPDEWAIPIIGEEELNKLKYICKGGEK